MKARAGRQQKIERRDYVLYDEDEVQAVERRAQGHVHMASDREFEGDINAVEELQQGH